MVGKVRHVFSLKSFASHNSILLVNPPNFEMGHALFVLGAAGAGKTAFCRSLKDRGKPSKHIRLVNLDPAQNDAEDYDVNLCEHITVEEVMDECDFGPNGALFHALEEMCTNISELNLHDFEDEYFLFDCPGQIELFLHSDIMNQTISHVRKFARVAVVYLTDATNFITSDKHLYAALCATITAGRLDVPVINLLSKCDLIEPENLDKILNPEPVEYDGSEYGRLRSVISEYVDYNGLADYLPLNWNDEEMVENVFMMLDHVLQRYDDVEPREIKE